MAQLILVVEDAHVPRILAAFGERVRMSQLNPNLPPGVPATSEQTRQEILKWVRSITLEYERGLAAKAAADGVTPIGVS